MRIYLILAAVFSATLLIHADMGFARAGGSRSFGSRGSRSYQSSPSGAQPLQRSTAPQSAPRQANAPVSAPAANPITSRPFLSGIAGGLLGAGIGHMLFGGGSGYGAGGFGGAGGGGMGILPLLLIGLAVFFGFRYFRRRSMGAFAPVENGSVLPFNAASGSYPGISESTQDISVAESDIAEFKKLFLDVQNAWSKQNINQMRLCMTPEMVGYFNDELSANISRGVSNQIDQITLRDMETVEAWQEDNLHYASVRISWDACDYDIRLDRQPNDADYVASGDRIRPANVQEQWTFSRIQNGRWLLSAIQQL